MRIATLSLGFVLFASPLAYAQERSTGSPGDDAGVQTVRYVARRAIHVRTAPGSNLTILFEPDERIVDIQLSDYTRYQATLSATRDSVVVHANDVSSALSAAEALLRLSSDRRVYQFALSLAQPGQQVASVLQVLYSRGAIRQQGGLSKTLMPQYRLSGEREVRPATVRDDGSKTYIVWPADVAIPAVFAVEHGREEMVEGYVRSGIFTIDRVYSRLIFRIDKHEARAQRMSRQAAQ